MTRPRKSFSSAASQIDVPALEGVVSQSAQRVEFPPNASTVRSFDFTPWLAIGMDDIVRPCIDAVVRMVGARHRRVSTIVSNCRGGLRYLFDYFAAHDIKQLSQIDQHVIEGFIGWLRLSGVAYGTQLARYKHAKAMLVDLVVHDVLSSDVVVFPSNPFPQAERRTKGAAPLGWSERKRFVEALKRDLIAIAKDQFEGTDSAALVILMLAVALRTGINTHPLLELRIDCLQPHPLLKKQLLLQYVKYRAATDGQTIVRAPRSDVEEARTGMDVAAIIQLVLRRTAPLRSEADNATRDLLWLYVRSDQPGGRAMTTVSPNILADNIQKFVDRHQLVDDKGERLVMNVSRLRKTLANRLWRLSGGDLRAVARAMNHLPAVSEAHYLLPTPEAERNHKLMGEALVAGWRTYRPSDPAAQAAENTPVGRCGDPVNGEHAPRTGEACMDFMSCFTCRSFILVEDERDLHRLFSFYGFLERERANASSEDWRAQHAAILKLIDEVTGKQFDAGLVAAARSKALESPIKFWRDPIIREAAAHGTT